MDYIHEIGQIFFSFHIMHTTLRDCIIWHYAMLLIQSFDKLDMVGTNAVSKGRCHWFLGKGRDNHVYTLWKKFLAIYIIINLYHLHNFVLQHFTSVCFFRFS